MKEKQNTIGRRNFLKSVGAAGLGSVLASTGAIAGQNESNAAEKTLMPKRKLGKTGLNVPCLSLGTMFDLVDNQIILRSTLKYGVSYWDTSNVYAGGNSELGIGKYLEKNPEVRNDLIIVSKASRANNVKEVEERLQLSLQRMNTDYIDLYYAPHGASDPAQFTDELKVWVENAKKRKLIRFFGFSTHQNVAECLTAASKLGWIDVVMPMFNFRVMQDPKMQAAVDACYKANIGIVAMKTTGKTTIRKFKQAIETAADKKMITHFLERGFTPEQACIKFALQDERISSACVQMDSVAIIKENVAAVLDKPELTRTDKQVLKEYAEATCTGYCAGCGYICNSTVPDAPYVSDIMRYLMYYNSYGDTDRARELFAEIPGNVRDRLLSMNYGAAEARCPQHLPIGELVAEAVGKLA